MSCLCAILCSHQDLTFIGSKQAGLVPRLPAQGPERGLKGYQHGALTYHQSFGCASSTGFIIVSLELRVSCRVIRAIVLDVLL